MVASITYTHDSLIAIARRASPRLNTQVCFPPDAQRTASMPQQPPVFKISSSSAFEFDRDAGCIFPGVALLWIHTTLDAHNTEN